MAKRLFGAIPGIVEGDLFKTRLELSAGHVHAPTQAGISGSEKEGADSIVLSGGYEDDLDLGDEIIYTGHGGRDLITGKQTTNQPMTRGNLALALNAQNGLPVRVIRGPNRVSPHAPLSGYQYDGLYQVKDYWQGTGRSGYTVWRYRLVKIYPENINQNPSNLIQEVDGKSLYQTRRFEITTQRIIRDTALSRQVKALYNFHCQVCQIRLTTNSAPYAEAAHIRPLGRPHEGPDALSNLLCLCPNHHVQFDFGGIALQDNLELLGQEGRLHFLGKHQINLDFIRYHREHFWNAS